MMTNRRILQVLALLTALSVLPSCEQTRGDTADKQSLDTAASGSAYISWKAPTQRADGSTLDSSEISGYELFYSDTADGPLTSLTTLSASELNVVVNELSSGTHYFALATVDSSGIESVRSSTFSVTIN